ncbi:uncharacterized protein CDAR_16721 [Caerostris darwini]|uniref:Uncharacterized protein n=1 Tax=Caerostris darwini TaxID=1538125 RepID=A0AAV4UKV7_9ARAC|nr:uncharacterized protein CDAR_16721 [Caerostris darwini]
MNTNDVTTKKWENPKDCDSFFRTLWGDMVFTPEMPAWWRPVQALNVTSRRSDHEVEFFSPPNPGPPSFLWAPNATSKRLILQSAVVPREEKKCVRNRLFRLEKKINK